jgi:hypothetical protein
VRRITSEKKQDPILAKVFALIWKAHGMGQRLFRPSHHGTNAQVDRMKRMVKGATWKHYPYDDDDFLRMRVTGFMAPYNFARRLKTLRSFTP